MGYAQLYFKLGLFVCIVHTSGLSAPKLHPHHVHPHTPVGPHPAQHTVKRQNGLLERNLQGCSTRQREEWRRRRQERIVASNDFTVDAEKYKVRTGLEAIIPGVVLAEQVIPNHVTSSSVVPSSSRNTAAYISNRIARFVPLNIRSLRGIRFGGQPRVRNSAGGTLLGAV